MKNLSIVVLGLLLSINAAFATRYVTQTYTTPNYNYNPNIYNQNTYDMNISRLAAVERSLYGRTFEKQNANTRLNRLEQSVFSRTYPNIPFDERMNNLIMNYNSNYPNNYSQVSSKSRKIGNLINGLSNAFYGTPTGFTPQVQPVYGFGNTDPHYGHSSDYYGNRGWARNNYNIGSGMGIKLID